MGERAKHGQPWIGYRQNIGAALGLDGHQPRVGEHRCDRRTVATQKHRGQLIDCWQQYRRCDIGRGSRPSPSDSAACGRTAVVTSRRPLKTPTAYPPLRTSNAPTWRSLDAWASRAVIGSLLDGSGGNVTGITALAPSEPPMVTWRASAATDRAPWRSAKPFSQRPSRSGATRITRSTAASSPADS